MINSQMRKYRCSKYISTVNSYGEETLTPVLDGSVLMAINLLSENTQDNILYSGAEYVGLTKDEIDDTFVIQYDTKTRLKVKYVNPIGRLKQVYLTRMCD